jgi:hypothetical protein
MLQSAKMASKTTQKQSTAEIAYMLKAVRFAVETKHAELLVLASAVEALERKLVIAQDQDKAEQAEVSRQSMADHKHEDRQRLLARRT